LREGEQVGKRIDFGATHQSVRDLVRVNKVKTDEVPTFIKKFVRKYQIPSFFISELEQIAHQEIAKREE
jgi:hypothetical protein